MSKLLTPSLQVAMNELSNHDHSRFLTRTNGKVGRVDGLGHEAAGDGVNYGIMREGVVFQMTWVGAPTIYYGDEAGLCGFTDPDNRRTYPWGHENQELIEFHKIMIKIHKESSAIRTGSLRILTHGHGFLSYVRFNRKEQVVVILNNTNEIKECTIPVWIGELPVEGVMRRVMYSYEEGYIAEPEKVLIKDGEVIVSMGAYSAMVLKSAKPEDFEQEFWR